MIRFEQFSQYGNRLHVARQSYSGVPAWGRLVLAVFALPGILLLALSAAVFVLSMATLLLLTVPAYLLIARVAGSGWYGSLTGAGRRGGRGEPNEAVTTGPDAFPFGRRPRARQVNVTVID